MRISSPAWVRCWLAVWAHSVRQASSSERTFQSRRFAPKPSEVMSRVVSRTWAWGFSALSRWRREVSHHAAGHERVAYVIAQRGDLLVPVRFDGEFDFARELGTEVAHGHGASVVARLSFSAKPTAPRSAPLSESQCLRWHIVPGSLN